MRIKAPVVVSLNGAPKVRIPSVDFEVGVDGAGFTILNKHGYWPWGAEQHARKMRRLVYGIGRMYVAWVTSQDCMCEKEVLRKTEPHFMPSDGLDGPRFEHGGYYSDDAIIYEHQCRTVQSYLDLCAIAPDLPWLPVIQGFTLAQYLRCVEMYRSAGVDLTEIEWVGVGSICRRQGTREGADIIAALVRLGIRVHAFGFKADGLKLLREMLTDEEWHRLRADSAAWSKHAWKSQILLPGHYHGAKTKNCANCPEYANVRRLEIEASLEAA